MTGYFLADAARVARCTTANIAAWINRGLISTPLGHARAGHGRLYSTENVSEFAILGECSKVGIPLAAARDFLKKADNETSFFSPETDDFYLIYEPGNGLFRFTDAPLDFDDFPRCASLAIVQFDAIVQRVATELRRTPSPLTNPRVGGPSR